MRAQFPTLAQVRRADVEKVIRWNRTLPTAESDEELAVINANFARMRHLQKSDPAAYTRASKAVGW